MEGPDGTWDWAEPPTRKHDVWDDYDIDYCWEPSDEERAWEEERRSLLTQLEAKDRMIAELTRGQEDGGKPSVVEQPTTRRRERIPPEVKLRFAYAHLRKAGMLPAKKTGNGTWKRGLHILPAKLRDAAGVKFEKADEWLASTVGERARAEKEGFSTWGAMPEDGQCREVFEGILKNIHEMTEGA